MTLAKKQTIDTARPSLPMSSASAASLTCIGASHSPTGLNNKSQYLSVRNNGKREREHLQRGVGPLRVELGHDLAPLRVLANGCNKEKSIALHNGAAREYKHLLLGILADRHGLSSERGFIHLQKTNMKK